MKKYLLMFLLLCVGSMSNWSCKKGLGGWDFAKPDCDGVKTLTLSVSVNHNEVHACYNEGENLTYNICPTPSPCGGGDYKIIFTELNFNSIEVGTTSYVNSWIEECTEGKYVISTAVAANVRIEVKNQKGDTVFLQEFSAERDE